MQFAKEERYFMTLEKLSLNVYDEYRDTIDRYMELIPCEQRDKVDTATVHIMDAIQDINNQIEKYNFGMDSTHKEHFMNRIGNRMMLWRYAVVCLLTWLYSGEKSISPMKL
jgi:hypothetical protein